MIIVYPADARLQPHILPERQKREANSPGVDGRGLVVGLCRAGDALPPPPPLLDAAAGRAAADADADAGAAEAMGPVCKAAARTARGWRIQERPLLLAEEGSAAAKRTRRSPLLWMPSTVPSMPRICVRIMR